MTVITLASRMIARRRRIMLRAAIPLGVAAAALVVLAAVTAATAREVQSVERKQLLGELALHRPAAADEVRPGAFADLREAPGVLISRAWIAPAVVSGDAAAMAATAWFTDLRAEFAFRGIAPVPGVPAPSQVVIGTGSGMRGEMAARPGSAITVHIPGAEEVRAVVAAVVDTAEPGPVVFLPWSLLPGARSGGGPLPVDALGLEVVRVRGEEPLGTRSLESIAATGLAETGWRTSARSRMRSLLTLALAIAAMLYLVGGVSVAPSVGIVVRRYRSEFGLLAATGYQARYLRRLIITIGAVTGSVAAAIGAVAGMVLVAIVGARGLPAAAVLPAYWLQQNPAVSDLAPMPSTGVALAAVALATVAGACSALPATRRIGTMSPQGDPVRPW